MSIFAPLYKVIPFTLLSSSSKSTLKYLPKQNHHNKKFVPDLSYGKRPWFMNEMDAINIVQITGCQLLELYDPIKKRANFFTIKPTILYENEKKLYDGQYIIKIAPKVFYRFIVSKDGSSSVHPECYDIVEKDRYNSDEFLKKNKIVDLPDYDLEVNPALISKWEQSLYK